MITIVDYDAGNLRSVQRACRAVGLDSCITSDPEAVRRAERIVFPGVGAALHAMDVLRATGLDATLRAAHAAGTPILGICLGTQIVLGRSEEGGGGDPRSGFRCECSIPARRSGAENPPHGLERGGGGVAAPLARRRARR